MQILAESGKSATGDLSTFKRFAGGQGWISSQLTATCGTIVRLRRDLAPIVALRQEAQAQSIELDKACCILLIVGAGIIFKGHMRFGIERMG